MALSAVPPVTPAEIIRAFTPAPADWLPAHRGIDLAAVPGQALVAPRSGTVVFAGRIAHRPVLALRSRGVRFTFEPVTTFRIVGERVSPGRVLGIVARGGHCDGQCLHWGAKVDGQYVDPAAYLPGRPVVLKPVAR